MVYKKQLFSIKILFNFYIKTINRFSTRNAGSYITINRISSHVPKLGVWMHFSFVLRGIDGTYYLNGEPVLTGTTTSPRKIVRTGNYLGKSNWLEANSNAMAEFDDLKIFNRSLTIDELFKVMNSYY
jgi:hypothetical protein